MRSPSAENKGVISRAVALCEVGQLATKSSFKELRAAVVASNWKRPVVKYLVPRAKTKMTLK